MKTAIHIEPQFIVDKSGKKTGIYMDIKSYQKFMDEIEDLYLANLALAEVIKDKDSKRYSLEEVKSIIRKRK